MMGEPYPRAQCDRRTERGNAVLAVLGGMSVGVILVLLAWLFVLLTKDDPATQAAGTQPTTPPAAAITPPAPTTTRTVTVTPSVKGTSTSETTTEGVTALPPGLFCRDLKAKGFGYAAAVDYWYLYGQPDQMDADRNGIPCETVYSRSAIAGYWNGRQVNGVTYWSAGLFCRDLAARGASYAEAVRYWWYYGMPARMDADKNGIPCETVYSKATVNAFWYP